MGLSTAVLYKRVDTMLYRASQISSLSCNLRKLKLYSVTTSNLSAAVDFTMASKKTTQNLPEAEDQQQEVGARQGGTQTRSS